MARATTSTIGGRLHRRGLRLRSFSCWRWSAWSRLTAAASRVRALPAVVTLPIPVGGSVRPVLSAASQPGRLRSPRQVGRTSPTRVPPTRTCQVRVSWYPGARTSSYWLSAMTALVIFGRGCFRWLRAGLRCGRHVRRWWTRAASCEVGVAFLGGLAVAGAHRGRDLGPGRPAAAGRLDEREFAVLEFGCQFPCCRDRGEGGRSVHAVLAGRAADPGKCRCGRGERPGGIVVLVPGMLARLASTSGGRARCSCPGVRAGGVREHDGPGHWSRRRLTSAA